MNWLKNKFALTEKGARGVVKAIRASVLVNFSLMSAMVAILFFVDNLLKGNSVENKTYYIIIFAIVVVMYIVLNLEYKRTFNTTYAEAKDLRIAIADQLKKMPISYFSKHDISDVAQTIMQDVLDLEHSVSHAIPRAVATAIFLTIVAIMMMVSNWKLGLAAMIPMLIGVLMLAMSKNSQKIWSEKFFWKLRKNAEIFQENIEMQQEIKSYGMYDEKKEEVYAALNDSEDMHIKAEIRQALPVLSSFSVIKFAIGAVVLVGSMMLAKNEVELIYVIGFLIGSVKLIDGVGAMDENLAELFYIDARTKRINDLKNTKIQAGKDVELEKFDIEFKDISFGYNSDVKVLDGVSFVAKQGEVTAIVGPSGCGKTTILRLISRLFDYDSGNIEIDGYDIKKISTDSLFENVSMVFQDVTLFNASIMENIRIGRQDATDEEIVAAAKAANCDEFIRKLPNGYQTLIGENGSKLSGGERQRLSIARAFLKDAPILLLDEISASLDVDNEMKIQESLNKLIVGKTVVIISHRLKSVEMVDKIIVMDKGKISAQGTHAELLEKSKLYNRLIEKSNLTEKFTY
ncbi:ATP-binding cassette, subfamily B [Peptoniphilus asaccharolyticus DSM 20463]|uniref:ATP-binding cassette, subfamily B n=1 Tax=Peptoniphilus asaccharolyticus DSM 20463 TaxID=573058 RepID=A0A1W1VJ60_PEPAS|nr:ABC transporter ATP-binding protein [Peptoniphilus asaccharolyticus]MBL7574378.1 ABC transporter ATP-binding protein [Peptoniphilus asaccharolyticus]SMB93313.1 ATP-binding cassette, subfamily B [Peptoniphilus asaccharolyticus DSM 20463]